MPRAKAKSKKTVSKGRTKAKVKTKAKVVARRKTSSAKKKAAAPKRLVAITEKQTRTQIIKAIAEETELTTAQVKAVLECQQSLAERHLKKRGSGEFTIPYLGVKVRRVRKKATKSRMGRNPFTGEEIKIPAKPARDVIKVSAMKALKEVID